MIWNISRFKVFFLGLLGLIVVYTAGINTLVAMTVFTSFEKITLCYLVLQLIFVSLFLLFWGLEPVMPELKWGEDK